MRQRHVPRVCRHCQEPMPRQEDACWRCGTEWASAPELRTTLLLIHGDAHARIEDGERWTDEGGSFRSDVTAPLPARAAGG